MSENAETGAWDTPTLPLPSRDVVRYLVEAVEAEIHAYCLKGGGRDFRHEGLQDAAREYLEALEWRREAVA